jgi:ATP-dependent helicase/nuclease subunit A
MYKWTRMLPVCAAVERIFDRTGLLAKASAESAGGAEAGKLIFAVDCLRAASEVGASFAEAVGELEARLGTGEADPPSLEPGRQDVVRLMNLHKAKGLEAKVVFLADPLAGWKPTANVRIIREGDRPTGYFQVTRRKGEYQTEVVAEPQSWAAHEAAELAYVAAEECRLLYVACTRPMEMLVVSRWDKQDRLSVRPWEPLAPFLGGASRLEIPPAIGVPPIAVREITDEIRLTGAKQREILGSHLRQPTSIMEAVTKAARGDTHGSPPTEEPHGPVWGRMIHALLAYAVSNPTCTKEDVWRVAKFHASGNIAAEEFTADAIDTVLTVTASSFWKHVQQASTRLVEVPVMARIFGSDLPRFETGIIDLAIRFDAGWEIIDYKTEDAGMDQLSDRYGEQTRRYAAHWEQITGEPVVFAGIYSIRENALSVNTISKQ